MSAWYNEIDPYCAEWLRNLIDAGRIPPGDVDERSIKDVSPDDLKGYTQCHFFAGLGGWAYACRLAGWPDDREIWTGSPPCQPFSNAGRRRGAADERHLWPGFHRLIAARRPALVVGEQVAAAVGKDWLDGVFADLEGVGYACRAAVVPACGVNAPHRRERLWFVADADQSVPSEERKQRGGQQRGLGGDPQACAVEHALGWPAQRRRSAGELSGASGGAEKQGGERQWRGDAFVDTGEGGGAKPVGDVLGQRLAQRQGESGDDGTECAPAERAGLDAWAGAGWIVGADGKARRVPQSGIRLLADGIPARVARLRALGNAIVPQVAAEVIAAYLDAEIFG